MNKSNHCRFGLHIGLNSLSYVKVERKSNSWRLTSSGQIPWDERQLNLEGREAELKSLIQRLVKEEAVHGETVCLSLHSRYCVTRVATGDAKQVEEQIAEIIENGQHYLQLGLGDKLFGSSISSIDDQYEYGQVAIIKRGLIETIENAIYPSGLQLEWVDGAIGSTCRLVGFSGLDQDSPLLLVWLGPGGAEIGISYQGRMQLSYHAGSCKTVDETAETIRKHLKRLKRFCDRYRQVDGSRELEKVLVLSDPAQSMELKGHLQQLDFKQVHTLEDLSQCSKLAPHVGNLRVDNIGVVSALGGLLIEIEEGVLPATDIYESYLEAKPRSMTVAFFKNYWHSLTAAVLFLTVFLGSTWCKSTLSSLHEEFVILTEGFNEENEQIQEISESEELLTEYRRLEKDIFQEPIQEIVLAVASCLPEDTRIDWFGIDGEDRLILKGTMLHGDKSYEILKALQQLPAIGEVALESVGRATNSNTSATFFQINCEFASQPTNSQEKKVASVSRLGGSR